MEIVAGDDDLNTALMEFFNKSFRCVSGSEKLYVRQICQSLAGSGQIEGFVALEINVSFTAFCGGAEGEKQRHIA